MKYYDWLASMEYYDWHDYIAAGHPFVGEAPKSLVIIHM
jgi:hypothetical protein